MQGAVGGTCDGPAVFWKTPSTCEAPTAYPFILYASIERLRPPPHHTFDLNAFDPKGQKKLYIKFWNRQVLLRVIQVSARKIHVSRWRT